MLQTDQNITALEAIAYKKASVAICITDKDGVYVSVSDKYANLFGYDRQELVGQSFLQITPEGEREKQFGAYKKAIIDAGFETTSISARVKKNGEIVHVSTTDIVVAEAGYKYMISTAKNITEDKALEEKRLINEQLLFQQSKIAALSEMMSAIAHQWRQPLNALGIMVQDVKIAKQFGELSDEYIDSFDTNAMHQIRFMSKTIDEFRNFFKPDATKQNFALISAALDVVSLIGSQLECNGIKVNVYSPLDIDEPGEALIYGYPNEFKQLILNLISNSKDAIVEKKAKEGDFEAFINVEIGVSKNSLDRYAFMRIIDNGAGIKEEILPRIFEPYFTTKEQGKGTGVGLYMTKMIIEQNMGGSITALNRVDGGAIFELRFDEGKGVFVG